VGGTIKEEKFRLTTSSRRQKEQRELHKDQGRIGLDRSGKCFYGRLPNAAEKKGFMTQSREPRRRNIGGKGRVVGETEAKT